MHHNLKAHPDSYELIAMRKSQVQLRKNDRGFKVGDTCTFYEWNPARRFFTGHKTVDVTIEIVLEKHEGLTNGWCLIVLDIPTSNITSFDPNVTGRTSLENASA